MADSMVGPKVIPMADSMDATRADERADSLGFESVGMTAASWAARKVPKTAVTRAGPSADSWDAGSVVQRAAKRADSRAARWVVQRDALMAEPKVIPTAGSMALLWVVKRADS